MASSVGGTSNPYLLYPDFLTPSDFMIVKEAIELIEQEREEPSFVQIPCMHPVKNDVIKALVSDVYYREVKHICETCKGKVRAIFHADDDDIRIVTKDALHQLTIIHNRYLRNISFFPGSAESTVRIAQRMMFVSVRSLEVIANEFFDSCLLSCGHSHSLDNHGKKSRTLVQANDSFLCEKHKKGMMRPSHILPNRSLEMIGRKLLEVVACARRQIDEVKVNNFIVGIEKKLWVPLSEVMKSVRKDSPVWTNYIRYQCSFGVRDMKKFIPPLKGDAILGPICADAVLAYVNDQNESALRMLNLGYILKLHEVLPGEFLDKTKAVAREVEEGKRRDSFGAVDQHPYILAFLNPSTKLPFDKYFRLVKKFASQSTELPDEIAIEIWDTIFQNCRKPEYFTLCNFVAQNCTYLPIFSLTEKQFFEFVAILLDHSNICEIHPQQLENFTTRVIEKFEGKIEAITLIQKKIECYLRGQQGAWLKLAHTELSRLLSSSSSEARQHLTKLVLKYVWSVKASRSNFESLNLTLIQQLVLYPDVNKKENFECTIALILNGSNLPLPFELMIKFMNDHLDFSDRREYRDVIPKLNEALLLVINTSRNPTIEEYVREYYNWAKSLSNTDKRKIKKLFSFIYQGIGPRIQVVRQQVDQLIGAPKEDSKKTQRKKRP